MNREDVVIMLLEWKKARQALDAIEEQLRAQGEDLDVGEAIVVDDVRLYHFPGRGSYMYEELVNELEPTTEQVEKRSKVVVDWNKLSQDLGATEAQKAKYYVPGTPSVQIGFVK